MKSLAALLSLPEDARLTGVMTLPFSRVLGDVSGSILLRIATGLSCEGSIAAPALSVFVPRAIAVIHGVQPDGEGWAAVFEHRHENALPRSNPGSGFRRALDLTGIGAHHVRCREFDWSDMVQLFQEADCPSVIDWSLTDLITAQVINLWTGDLSAVVTQITAEAPRDSSRGVHRRQRIDETLRSWSTQYRGPEQPGLI